MFGGTIGRIYDNPGPDEGWSWVILAGSFVISSLTFGIGTSGAAGVLFSEFVKIFQVSRTEATWPFATLGLTQCLLGLSVGFLNHVMSTRAMLFASSLMCSASLILCFWATSMLYITFVYGLLFGAGLGLANTLASVLICKYFVKYRSTANAIYSSGLPVSGILTPFLVNYLLHNYDLRRTMLLLGAIVLNMMIASSLMRTRKPRNFPILQRKKQQVHQELMEQMTAESWQVPKKSLNQTVREYTLTFRQPMFLLISFQAVIGIQASMGVVQSLPDYMMDFGFPLDSGVIVVSTFSACDLFGRLASGLISDKGLSPSHFLGPGLMLLVTIGTACLAIVQNFYLLVISSSLIGMATGASNNLINIFYCEYLGMKKLFFAISLRLFLVGLLGIFRPLVVGIARDYMGSYTYYYYLLAAASLMSAAFWVFEPYLKAKAVAQEIAVAPQAPTGRVKLFRLSSRLLPKETYAQESKVEPSRKYITTDL